MKTAITEIMDEIEMEHNNGVEISQKVLWKMLLKAKEKEKQQIIDAFNQGFRDGESETMTASKEDVSKFEDAINYYNETFKNY